MNQVALAVRPLAATLDELLEGCTSREPMIPDDSKSGARFEWVVIGGERLVLKYQDARDDWIMRSTGDVDGTRFAKLWASGLLDAVPEVIDHAVVGAAVEDGVGAILLRDVTDALLPPGDDPFELGQHLRFLDHMAQLHAHFWGWRDRIGLTDLKLRYLAFSPSVAASELARGSDLLVPKVMEEGWARFPEVSRQAATAVSDLLDDPAPLLNAITSDHLPTTFVHGDWKAANLGTRPDGRTVLLDWGEVPGEASPFADLCWYLALNSARLPHTKEDTIDAYRDALERHGVDTAGWWEEALALELLATMIQFGWEKTLSGPGPELAWWETWAMRGAGFL